jgi:hypothetical protein
VLFISVVRASARSMDSGQRPLILILVAVNETIEDVMMTGEGQWAEGALLKLGRIRVALLEEIAASGPTGLN